LYACVKRKLFKLVLNVSTFTEFLTASGRLFQTLGPATAKARQNYSMKSRLNRILLTGDKDAWKMTTKIGLR